MNNNDFTTIIENGHVIGLKKMCPSCETISKFKFKKIGDVKPYGKKCIKCYSKTSNFKKFSEGYFKTYYINNKDTINNAAKLHYQNNRTTITDNEALTIGLMNDYLDNNLDDGKTE